MDMEITTEVHNEQTESGNVIGVLHIKKTSEMSEKFHQRLEEAFDIGVGIGCAHAELDPEDIPSEPSFETEEEYEAFDLGFDVGHTNASLDD